MVSLYFVAKIDIPDSPYARQMGHHAHHQARWNLFQRAVNSQPSFMRITTNTWLHGMGVDGCTAVCLVFCAQSGCWKGGWASMERSPRGDHRWIAIWRPLIQRQGELNILRFTIVCVGLYPVVVGLLPSLTVILVATALNGLLVPGGKPKPSTRLAESHPENERPGYTALYMTVANIGAFIGPFLGIAMANAIGFAPRWLFVVFYRSLANTSFWIWPVSYPNKPQVEEPV
jgi:MFS family permease